MLLGEKIKELRDEHGVLQRQLAALLEIDTPMFSKIERGDRRAKRTQVIQLAEYFKIDKNELLTLWLADKVLDAIEGEDELKQTPSKLQRRKWVNLTIIGNYMVSLSYLFPILYLAKIFSSISILCRPVVVRKFFLTVSNVQLENHSANVAMTKFVVKSPPMLY